MLDMDFATKLKRLADAKNLKPAELGRRIGGVAPSTMHYWFKGIHKPDIETALRIARELGTSLDFLADNEQDEPPATDADMAWIVEAVRTLGPELAKRRLLDAPPWETVVVERQPDDPDLSFGKPKYAAPHKSQARPRKQSKG